MASLAHSQISEGSGGDRRIALAHGIFGRGRNWRTFARALVRARPDWTAVLFDLRHHGESMSIDAPPPHTLAAAAADVRETLTGEPIDGLLGHSFGGKVMLAARAELDVGVTWMIDSSPSARPEAMTLDGGGAPTVALVLGYLESLPSPFVRRDDFIDALAARGVARGIGQFLAMNLVRVEGGFELAIDLEAIHELLTSYFATDLWPEVERTDRGALHVAIAGRDSALTTDDQRRLEDIAARSAHLTLHRFPDAGHWIHVEEPEALLDAVAASLT